MDTPLTPESWRNDVRKKRKSAGISQQELSRLTGITQPRVSLIENGGTDPKFTEVVSITTALGMSFAMLPTGFLREIEFTLMECEKAERRKTGPKLFPQRVLGDRAYL